MAEKNSHIVSEDSCLDRILPILAEIPQGVSPAVFKSIPHIKNPNEIHKYQCDSIITMTQDIVKKVWKENEITEKVSRLKELEAESPKESAWRPTTGKTEVNAIIADILTNTKEELQEYLKNLEQESAELQLYVKNFHKQTVNQLAEIYSVEQMWATVKKDSN